MNYFYKYGDGPELGPFTLNEMKSKFINGEISSTALVRGDASEEWVFAAECTKINDEWTTAKEQQGVVKQYLFIVVLVIIAVVFTTGYYYRYYYGVPKVLLESYGINSSDYFTLLQKLNDNKFYIDVPKPNCRTPINSNLEILCSREDFQNIAWMTRRLKIYAEENATKKELDHKTSYAQVYVSNCKDQMCMGKQLAKEFYESIDRSGKTYLIKPGISLPQSQLNFQRLVTDLPKIPNHVKGTRDEEQYLKKQNDLQDLWGMNESSNGLNKIGVNEIKDWKCYINNNMQLIDITQSISCTPKGMTIHSNIYVINANKNFDKIYLNDVLTISGKIRILEINPTMKFVDAPNHYTLWIQDGSVEKD